MNTNLTMTWFWYIWNVEITTSDIVEIDDFYADTVWSTRYHKEGDILVTPEILYASNSGHLVGGGI